MRRFQGTLLISDCDGTLLNSNRETPFNNIEAIRYYTAYGGLFVLATGRPKNGARHILEQFPDYHAPAVFFNGALICGIPTGKILLADPIGTDVVQIAKCIQCKFPSIGLEAFTLDQALILRDSEVTRYHFQILQEPPVFAHPEQLPSKGVLKLFATGERTVLEEVREYLLRTYPDILNAVLSSDIFLEIFSRTSNKGSALTALKQLYPEIRRVYAVGDNDNDIPMLQKADLAFIPANGTAQAKACGVPVCSCDDGALSDVLTHLDQLHT